jgi:hypothetical protein
MCDDEQSDVILALRILKDLRSWQDLFHKVHYLDRRETQNLRWHGHMSEFPLFDRHSTRTRRINHNPISTIRWNTNMLTSRRRDPLVFWPRDRLRRLCMELTRTRVTILVSHILYHCYQQGRIATILRRNM